MFGDYLDQAKKAGLRIHEAPNAAAYWVILTGQTTPDREDYCPTCPWVGDPKDAKSRENARKVRLAMNLAVNKKAIINALWRGTGSETPFSYYYYPFHKGYSADWKIPPYDPERAKKLLAEAGHAGGFEIRVNPDGHGLCPRRPGRHGGGGSRLGEGRHQGPARAGGDHELPAEDARAEDRPDLHWSTARRPGTSR